MKSPWLVRRAWNYPKSCETSTAKSLKDFAFSTFAEEDISEKQSARGSLNHSPILGVELVYNRILIDFHWVYVKNIWLSLYKKYRERKFRFAAMWMVLGTWKSIIRSGMVLNSPSETILPTCVWWRDASYWPWLPRPKWAKNPWIPKKSDLQVSSCWFLSRMKYPR